MSRRRYLSTSVSTDVAVAKLAKDAGEFAALLYTWMIPHAGDDASLPGDPEELLLLVVPGFRWKTAEDVALALENMRALGLIEKDGDRIRFPESFFRHQSYITEKRRRTPQPTPTPPTTEDAPQNSADLRTAAQNPASLKVKLKLKDKSLTVPNGTAAAEDDREVVRLDKPQKATSRYGEVLGHLKQLAPELPIYGTEGQNAKACKESAAPPALIAEAYVALHQGEWEDDFVRKRGSLKAVIENLGGYQSWRRMDQVESEWEGEPPPPITPPPQYYKAPTPEEYMARRQAL